MVNASKLETEIVFVSDTKLTANWTTCEDISYQDFQINDIFIFAKLGGKQYKRCVLLHQVLIPK